MKKIVKTSQGMNYTAANLGKMDDIKDYVYLHPGLKQEIPGKVFLGKKLKMSGAEVSFQFMPPHTDIPFFHRHVENEEVYVFLKGKGQFQIDGDIFEVEEGSVIRINPTGKRTWRNHSSSPLIFMVVQVKRGTLEKYETADGEGSQEEISW